MRRRARAAGFLALALACAGLAASLAEEYRGGVEAQLGELRPVVIAASDVDLSGPFRPRHARELLGVRRVPTRFAPADALADPIEALGQRPRGVIPAGSYLTAAHLRSPGAGRGGRRRPARLAPGREAVEITVVGASALASAGDPPGASFDVVATGEPAAGGPGGRTSVVATRVRLLDLREAAPGAGDPAGLGAAPPGTSIATVAASRAQALRLIEAQSYARELRLIGTAGPGDG